MDISLNKDNKLKLNYQIKNKTSNVNNGKHDGNLRRPTLYEDQSVENIYTGLSDYSPYFNDECLYGWQGRNRRWYYATVLIQLSGRRTGKGIRILTPGDYFLANQKIQEMMNQTGVYNQRALGFYHNNRRGDNDGFINEYGDHAPQNFVWHHVFMANNNPNQQFRPPAVQNPINNPNLIDVEYDASGWRRLNNPNQVNYNYNPVRRQNNSIMQLVYVVDHEASKIHYGSAYQYAWISGYPYGN